jgi:hypothetical protein
MTEKKSSEVAADEELPLKDQVGSSDGNYQPKLKRPYDKILTDLSEEDLQSPGVYKLILSKSSELEYENYELKKGDTEHRRLEVAYASVSMELSNLKSAKKSVELLFSASLGAGTCLVGLAFSIHSAGAILGGFVVAGIGIVLSAASIAVVLHGRKKDEV